MSTRKPDRFLQGFSLRFTGTVLSSGRFARVQNKIILRIVVTRRELACCGGNPRKCWVRAPRHYSASLCSDAALIDLDCLRPEDRSSDQAVNPASSGKSGGRLYGPQVDQNMLRRSARPKPCSSASVALPRSPSSPPSSGSACLAGGSSTGSVLRVSCAGSAVVSIGRRSGLPS